ncbi:MAG: hypothetical protein GY809_09480, partial [Planctomycetes bacterium]|nr:hypothetical protein [Planctomycetota bacterium]
NILRLHDYKYDTHLAGDQPDGSFADGTTPNVVCANCHYSPALDLAHLGPNDDNGKEQTQHASMSRVMHGYHGSLSTDFTEDYGHLFPNMPPPNARTAEQQEDLLQQTCYNCHPGKRTKCLRGAMGDGGMVCQDCHGQLAQVGDDFSENFPHVAGDINLDKRVPWASEPKCQSCHVGDVRQVKQLKTSGALGDALINVEDKHGNADGLRLRLAYKVSNHKSNGGPDNLPLLDFSSSRFASNFPLYRLSGGENEEESEGEDKGHEGLSCEGCHGSTHAIWPNANPWSN